MREVDNFVSQRLIDKTLYSKLGRSGTKRSLKKRQMISVDVCWEERSSRQTFAEESKDFERRTLSVFWERKVAEMWPEMRKQRDWTEEFDPGSDWTLAACFTHASRTAAWGQPWWRVANGWVIYRNVPRSGGQPVERLANTAYDLRMKVGDLRASRSWSGR